MYKIVYSIPILMSYIEIFTSLNIEYKMCMNNEVNDTGSSI